MRSLRITVLFLLASIAFYGRGIMAQNLQVLVLDALDGKPQANVEVEYFCTGAPRNGPPKTALTDGQGLAKISISCGDKQEINISVYPSDKKEQCGVGPVTLKDILSVGVIAKPDAPGGIWCPTKVSKKLKPLPGQVTMFIKKPTWWQSHVAG